MTEYIHTTMKKYNKAIDRLMECRSTLLTIVGADDAGRGLIRNLETAIAELMPVYTFDGDGKPNGGIAFLSTCFPDDPDEISRCLDAIGRDERYAGGGGAFAAFEIERCGFAGAAERKEFQAFVDRMEDEQEEQPVALALAAADQGWSV